MTSHDNSEGYVYVLYNPIYVTYGEIYKIGQAKDLNKRINSYSTSYPEDSEVKYSVKHKYYKELERIAHLYLKEYRMNNNREFFKCNLDLIKETLDKVKEYTLEDISTALNKTSENIINGYNTTINEPINLSKENIIKVYKEDSKEIIKSDIMNQGVKLIVKIFIEKICTNKDGNLLLECIDKNNHKYRYTDTGNKVITISSDKLFLLLNSCFNIVFCIANEFNLSFSTEYVGRDHERMLMRQMKEQTTNMKGKFKYNLLNYFL